MNDAYSDYKLKSYVFKAITSIDVHVFDSDNKNLLSLSSYAERSFIQLCVLSDFEQVLSVTRQSPPGTLCQHATDWHTLYISMALFKHGERMGTVIAGPILQQHVSDEDIGVLVFQNKLNKDYAPVLDAFYKSLKVFTYQDNRYLTDFIYNLFINELHKYQTSKGQLNPKISADEQGRDFQDQFLNHLAFVEMNYAHEKKMLHAVETGNKHLLFNESGFKHFYLPCRTPSNPLRHDKNLMLTLNSLCCRAAIKGGLPLSIAHTISERYAILIENTRSFSKLKETSAQMILKYCNYVKEYKLRDLGPLVANAVSAIHESVYEFIKLDDIASKIHITPGHLSRQFKKEMGTTITNYIHEVKCKEAAHLIRQGKYSLSEISQRLGYHSLSYFSTTFKKCLGTCPNQYIENKFPSGQSAAYQA